MELFVKHEKLGMKLILNIHALSLLSFFKFLNHRYSVYDSMFVFMSI